MGWSDTRGRAPRAIDRGPLPRDQRGDERIAKHDGSDDEGEKAKEGIEQPGIPVGMLGRLSEGGPPATGPLEFARLPILISLQMPGYPPKLPGF